MKKYEILKDDYIELEGTILYRIKALKNFGRVKAVEIGGYIEKEYNLSQEDNCWVYDKAKVYGGARVYDNAIARGQCEIYDEADVCGGAKVYGNAVVRGLCDIYGGAVISGNAEIFGNAKVFDNAKVCDNAKVSGDAMYKKYILKLSNGKEIPLLSKNNREALKLAGKFIRNTNLYLQKIIDEEGVVILEQ